MNKMKLQKKIQENAPKDYEWSELSSKSMDEIEKLAAKYVPGFKRVKTTSTTTTEGFIYGSYPNNL